MLLRSVFACAVLFTAANSATAEEWDVWPDKVPGEPTGANLERIEKSRGKDTEERIAFVDQPTITVMPAPKDRRNGAAIVICPGGGYNILAWPKEGIEVGEYFNSLGVSAFVLKYRVPRRDPANPHVAPLMDAQRTIRLVRQNAARYDIDPERVGILGFSAGGNLAFMAGTRWRESTYKKVDAADDLSCRPAFMAPIYAAYLGDPADDSKLGPQVKVDQQTPPTFLAVTQDDKNRGAHAALLFARLTRLRVPAEVHVFTKGGHGYGIRPSSHPVSKWHVRCGEWLEANGFLKASETE